MSKPLETRWLPVVLMSLSVGLIAAGRMFAGGSASPLRLVADVPMPGPAVRFDYQGFDPTTDRLFIARCEDADLSAQPLVKRLQRGVSNWSVNGNGDAGSAPPAK